MDYSKFYVLFAGLGGYIADIDDWYFITQLVDKKHLANKEVPEDFIKNIKGILLLRERMRYGNYCDISLNCLC